MPEHNALRSKADLLDREQTPGDEPSPITVRKRRVMIRSKADLLGREQTPGEEPSPNSVPKQKELRSKADQPDREQTPGDEPSLNSVPIQPQMGVPVGVPMYTAPLHPVYPQMMPLQGTSAVYYPPALSPVMPGMVFAVGVPFHYPMAYAVPNAVAPGVPNGMSNGLQNSTYGMAAPSSHWVQANPMAPTESSPTQSSPTQSSASIQPVQSGQWSPAWSVSANTAANPSFHVHTSSLTPSEPWSSEPLFSVNPLHVHSASSAKGKRKRSAPSKPYRVILPPLKRSRSPDLTEVPAENGLVDAEPVVNGQPPEIETGKAAEHKVKANEESTETVVILEDDDNDGLSNGNDIDKNMSIMPKAPIVKSDPEADAFGPLAVYGNLPPKLSVCEIVVVDFDRVLFPIASLNASVTQSHSFTIEFELQEFSWVTNPRVLEESAKLNNPWNPAIVKLLKSVQAFPSILTVLVTPRPVEQVPLIQRLLKGAGITNINMIAHGDLMQSFKLRKSNLMSRLLAFYDTAQNVTVYEGFQKDARDIRSQLHSIERSTKRHGRFTVHEVTNRERYVLPPMIERALVRDAVEGYNKKYPESPVTGVVTTRSWLYRVEPESRASLVEFTDAQINEFLTGQSVQEQYKVMCNSITILNSDLTREQIEKVGERGTRVTWKITSIGPSSSSTLAAAIEPVPFRPVITDRAPSIPLAHFKEKLPLTEWKIVSGPEFTTFVDVERDISVQ